MVSIIRQIPGSVVLVGHSYGEAITIVAGVEEDNVTFPVERSAEKDIDVSVRADAFPGTFAADIELRLAGALAASQRSLAAEAFSGRHTRSP
ncbi:hypothetical protein [Streptomyces bauhiniae]|uniref:hypothetical protein n=1 Tax=Streptomyces bauhiniae TaxID=2340725 RepID=UPI0035DACC2E